MIDEIVRGCPANAGLGVAGRGATYCAQFAEERDENGHRLVLRNGYRERREVTTAAGAIEVHAPRVNDRRVDPDTS